MIPYKPPKYKESAFNCPHCNAYSEMTWRDAQERVPGGPQSITDLLTSECTHCNGRMFWYRQAMVYPSKTSAPLPNLDLPDGIKSVFEEARNIHNKSPRGAAALLRLCIQKLCVHLGEKGKDLNTDIKNLVARGLPSKVQQALDVVRVVGNEAVHPGTIDISDDQDTVENLFKLINLIADKMITEPKEVDALYDQLPEPKKKGIEKRDKGDN